MKHLQVTANWHYNWKECPPELRNTHSNDNHSFYNVFCQNTFTLKYTFRLLFHLLNQHYIGNKEISAPTVMTKITTLSLKKNGLSIAIALIKGSIV